MKETGVVVYPVYCGNKEDTIATTLFHSLANITGGHCIQIEEAKALPEIVLSAVLEESNMDKLEETIRPFYNGVKKSLKNARFEQISKAVYAELKAKDIRVDSVLPNIKYTPNERL